MAIKVVILVMGKEGMEAALLMVMEEVTPHMATVEVIRCMDMVEATLVMKEGGIQQVMDMVGVALHMVTAEVIRCMDMMEVIQCTVRITGKGMVMVVSTEKRSLLHLATLCK